jgi:hypothetical protein
MGQSTTIPAAHNSANVGLNRQPTSENIRTFHFKHNSKLYKKHEYELEAQNNARAIIYKPMKLSIFTAVSAHADDIASLFKRP